MYFKKRERQNIEARSKLFEQLILEMTLILRIPRTLKEESANCSFKRDERERQTEHQSNLTHLNRYIPRRERDGTCSLRVKILDK
jgi:hypothetical protein